MTDYTPDTDNLFRIYESKAAADIAELEASLTYALNREAAAWERGDTDGARVWGIKIEKLERELKAAKGGNP